MSYWDTHTFAVGVDPGLTCTGLVVLGKPGDIVVARTYGSDPKDPREKRYADIRDSVLSKIVATVGIGSVQGLPFTIENNHITPGRSAQTALMQRGLIEVMATEMYVRGMDIQRASPAEVKRALTGFGKAHKQNRTRDAAGNEYPSMVEALAARRDAPTGLPQYKMEAVADALGAALAGIKLWEAANT